jgi:hypothetical protein
MTRPHEQTRHTIRIEADGRTVAEAAVEPTGRPGVVHSDLHVESGPVPPDTRVRLVDALLDDPAVTAAEHLVATMPLGDTEMLRRVRERFAEVTAHSAGATKIVDARGARRAP